MLWRSTYQNSQLSANWPLNTVDLAEALTFWESILPESTFRPDPHFFAFFSGLKCNKLSIYCWSCPNPLFLKRSKGHENAIIHYPIVIVLQVYHRSPALNWSLPLVVIFAWVEDALWWAKLKALKQTHPGRLQTLTSVSWDQPSLYILA